MRRMRRYLFVLAPVILIGCSFGGDRQQREVVSSRGAVCGDPAIQGTVIGPLPGSGGCGVQQAVEVTRIAGVALSQPAKLECGTARVLRDWIARDMVPAIGRMGGGVDRLRVAAHYACRSRNSMAGARLSEHARGRAIDIAAFGLRDGSEISVLKDWGGGRKGRVLRRLHRSACGPFGTVLGPDSDRHHRDHFHFDTARHRNGAYCR